MGHVGVQSCPLGSQMLSFIFPCRRRGSRKPELVQMETVTTNTEGRSANPGLSDVAVHGDYDCGTTTGRPPHPKLLSKVCRPSASITS